MHPALCKQLGTLTWHKWNNLPNLLVPGVSGGIPAQPGVYFLRYGSSMTVNWCSMTLASSFLAQGSTAQYTAKVSCKLKALCEAYGDNFGCSLLYVGKASDSNPLRTRLKQYYSSSCLYANAPVLISTSAKLGSHRGGKAVWALDNAMDHVEFAWLEKASFPGFFSALKGQGWRGFSVSSERDVERGVISASMAVLPLPCPNRVLPFANMQR